MEEKTTRPTGGIGGYGRHLIVSMADGKKIRSIDFNTVAPTAAAPGMFPLDASGEVLDRRNDRGWLAVSVPGILAGLQLALDRWGTHSLADLMAPAIGLARDGFPVSAGLAAAVRQVNGRIER